MLQPLSDLEPNYEKSHTNKIIDVEKFESNPNGILISEKIEKIEIPAGPVQEISVNECVKNDCVKDECKKEVNPCNDPCHDPCNDPCAVGSSWDWLGYFVLFFIAFTLLFWIIYYSLKPPFVLQSDSNQVDTAKVLLAAVVTAFILIGIVWLIKAAIGK